MCIYQKYTQRILHSLTYVLNMPCLYESLQYFTSQMWESYHMATSSQVYGTILYKTVCQFIAENLHTPCQNISSC